jgi:predicted RecB family nuclease
MLRLADNTVVLAASDITSFLACDHLFEQRRAVAARERSKPRRVDDPHAELVARRGEDFEAEQLLRLSDELGGHVDLAGPPAYTREALDHAVRRTIEAMRAGVPLIYQAQLFDGRWQGRLDFLRRIDTPSALGAHAYEIIDTKLARTVKPQVVHQLSLYNRLLAAVQGFEPALAFVLLGDGTEQQVELERYGALHRRVAARVERLALAGARETYPEPASHCGICRFASECDQRRRADDHLSLVAHARREQRRRLVDIDVTTVLELAGAPAGLDVGKLGEEAFDVLRHQAGLQVIARTEQRPTHRHLEPQHARGYARLPEPSRGDVFFDLEGDPYVGEGGIEYLWGWWTADRGYECVWAHDPAAEQAALERFVDVVLEQRRRHPGARVFHYAPHEASKLKSLAIAYATREDDVDDLLRNGALVDLYAVVRQALQVGEESYSLKHLERHHGYLRLERTVREGGGSIVTYEQWLATGDAALLEAIRAYNEDDCRSTLALRDWLLSNMRPEAAVEFGVDFEALAAPEPEEPHAQPAWLAEQEALAERLAAGLPQDAALDTVDEAERRLLSHLLLYHRREAKPEWWRFFELRDMTPLELVDQRDAVGLLARDETVAPVPFKRSLDWTYTFPPQEVKLAARTLLDPTTGERHTVVAVEDDHVVVRRGAGKPPPAPAALIDPGPIDVKALREGLAELAGSVLDADGRFAAARSLLRRELPRLRGSVPFRSSEEPTIEQMCHAVLELDGSSLVVQGPPGTGKTYRGARMVVAALRAGRRVGVTAQSHAAIQNLLAAIEAHAHEIGFVFSGVYKGAGYDSEHGLVDVVDDNGETEREQYSLLAGTAWLFGRPEHRDRLDLLFIDEAGQFSLANAAAVALAARGVVMLGDPQQLAQVTKAAHPHPSGASVLEHLLGECATVPAERGFFLPESWRMHPDVCAFVSECSYDTRLRSRAACAQRRVTSAGAVDGAGLRVLRVEHESCSQRSDEEAQVIAAACRDLLADGTVTDDTGMTRPLEPADIIVLAPYNLAVACIRAHVPAGVEVGTVDRFQGREAPVVFYAMTCSSGDDVPRGLDFLFSRNRLNVAVSRAQCLAVMVVNERLLDAGCRTLEAMELVDGACRFVEMALVRRLEAAPAVLDGVSAAPLTGCSSVNGMVDRWDPRAV